MPRNPKKKTNRKPDAQLMKAAVDFYKEGDGVSIRQTAIQFEIPYPTLQRYVYKFEKTKEMKFEPNYSNRKIFTTEQEKELVEYIFACSKMCYGITPKHCRQLAFKLARANGIEVPQNWEKHQEAGLDWFWGFKKRNHNLAIRKPEGCSLARATAFNKHNVNLFFDNLFHVFEREPKFSDGTRIFNLDETSTKTVSDKLPNVLTERGKKQVNQATSGERGVLVTTCCIVSAAGNTIPPVMVFPRKKIPEVLFEKAPPGTLALGDSSGWMTSDLFVSVMEHFVKHSGSSKANPSLLILDNHESHLSPKALDIAKDNGVTVLTIPPHTSSKLQVLDVTCYAPFKTYYSDALNSVLLRLKGTPASIYHVAECVRIAHERALTPSNIMSGFRKTGIFPFNRHIFQDDDFMSSSVTDRPIQNPDESESTSQPDDGTHPLNVAISCPLPTAPSDVTNTAYPSISPSDVRPYPKAEPRKGGNRRKGKSIIATDTPVKKEIEQRKLKSTQKSDKTVKRPAKRNWDFSDSDEY